MKTEIDHKGIEQLLDRVRRYLTPEKLAVVEEAYRFAEKAHVTQVRESGEPYLEHPLQVTLVLADLQLDSSCLAASLLHDVPEDTGVSLQAVEDKFGKEIAQLVDGVTKLGKINLQAPGIKESTDEARTRAENLRKMLLAMAQDIRVVLIKLADRLHNMRTLSALPPQKRLTIAQETMEIYAPLAHRLGIWELKWQLEDLAFRHLYPDKYREVVRLIATRRTQREEYIAKVIRILEEKLLAEGIHAQIKGRPKNIYSIYTKIQKYAAQGKEFSEIYDLLALRVLVDEVQDCYTALGVIHSLWHPMPGQFNDYIANPKQNMYQSLHTTVMSLDGRPLEVQVRTREMHRIAEYGVAAHWRYKEGLSGDAHFEKKMAWLRQLVEWQRELSGAEEFIESVKTDIFPDQVFVYTPKGEIKELPAGSTPLDFAYRIHTDLGHKCIGAKVKGKLVPLNYRLQNSDTVEIMTTKTGRGPSRDWLNPDLGYVNSTHAREKIRGWFKKQERTENIGRGRELLEKELRRLGIAMSDQLKIAQLFKYEAVEDFLAAIGCGDVNPRQIAVKLAQEEAPETINTTTQRPSTSTGIEIYGVGDLLTRIAQCCKPVPGDAIVGFISRGRGVAVHRADCPSIRNEDEKERIIKVEWASAANRLYPVDVIVDSLDRVGLLRDISAVVSADKVNISAVNMIHQDGYTIRILLTLEVTGIDQLSQVMSRLEVVRGVMGVARSTDRTKRGT